jgi:hypothetical protein
MPLFALTILLSAFLLFLVQPIIAKQILPWFGGSTAVWTTCMLFFQMLLLAGYSYAHLMTRQTPRVQARVHIALLAASLLALPIIPGDALKPDGAQDAALRILVVLALTVGLPYFLLSATGPLLQKWIAHRFPEKTVYRLFALSNFGSLLGLLAFPFVIEPFATSRAQSLAWSGAYALFALACGVTAWKAGRRAESAVASAAADSAAAGIVEIPAPRATDYGMWLALAALGSVILLAATSHMTQNIASAPFLWVLPLALYLISFIIAFEGRGGRGWYERNLWAWPALAITVAMAWGLSANRGVLDIRLAIPLYSAGVLLACVFCHGELARCKPAPRYLTEFYLTLSAGGAAGGLFVALVAPRVFPAYYELPLALIALAALAVWLWRDAKWLAAPALAATVATSYYGFAYRDVIAADVIAMHRNFYGVTRVKLQGTGELQVRRLLHGVILHGEQYTQGPNRFEPGTYYSRTSGVGRAIAVKQERAGMRLGVVGLGTGTLAAYGRAGDVVRFYELDPDVLQLALREFDYLRAAPAALECEIGDARLSMERELRAGRAQGFDVLAIDAFSSDSIPVHLLTREAFEVYARQIAPDGIIAVHISNRFLDLKPVLANIAAAAGLVARLVADDPGIETGASKTDWVLLAKTPSVFQHSYFAEAAPLAPRPDLSLWTDQFNNLFDALKGKSFSDWRAMFD